MFFTRRCSIENLLRDHCIIWAQFNSLTHHRDGISLPGRIAENRASVPNFRVIANQIKVHSKETFSSERSSWSSSSLKRKKFLLLLLYARKREKEKYEIRENCRRRMKIRKILLSSKIFTFRSKSLVGCITWSWVVVEVQSNLERITMVRIKLFS